MIRVLLLLMMPSRAGGMALFTVISGLGKPVFLTYVPQYLVTQLDFDIKSAGLLGSLPYLSNAGAHLIAGPLADKLHRDVRHRSRRRGGLF